MHLAFGYARAVPCPRAGMDQRPVSYPGLRRSAMRTALFAWEEVCEDEKHGQDRRLIMRDKFHS